MSKDGSGNPVLTLQSDFDRSWVSVGRALDNADIRVDDLNRSLGVYYVNIAEGAKKPDEDKPGSSVACSAAARRPRKRKTPRRSATRSA